MLEEDSGQWACLSQPISREFRALLAKSLLAKDGAFVCDQSRMLTRPEASKLRRLGAKLSKFPHSFRGPNVPRRYHLPKPTRGNLLNMRAATASVKWIFCLAAVTFASISVPIPSQAGSLSDAAAGSIDETLHKGQYQPAEIFRRLRLRHKWQQSRIHQLSHSRTYRLIDKEGKIIAEETVSVDYEAPHRETITVSSGFGSHFVRNHVFRKFINYEVQRVHNREDDWPITSENYDLRFPGQERMENANCLSIYASHRPTKAVRSFKVVPIAQVAHMNWQPD